jgi:hypothetical protein
MRLKEIEAMFTYFYDKLVHLSKPHLHPKNVERVRDKLKTEMDLDFYENWSYNLDNAAHIRTYSVYGFVAKIEGILTDSYETHTHETHDSGHPSHTVTNGPNRPRGGPSVDWIAVGLAAGKSIASMFKISQKWNEELEQMLDGAHSHIQQSQELLVCDLIKKRNDALESWKEVLENETV